MWITVATVVEREDPENGHDLTIVRLGIQTEQYMKQELVREIVGAGMGEWGQDVLEKIITVVISRHKLPSIAVTVVTWQDIFDGAKLTDGCSVGRVIYGHGMTDEDTEWQRIIDAEYDEVMAEYLEQQQHESMVQITETMVTDE